MEHQRIPVKTPNMNAHIESFHSILEEKCYSRNKFNSFMEVYDIVSDYMKYYISHLTVILNKPLSFFMMLKSIMENQIPLFLTD
ncbi:integrase core domain-containing protein [Anoxybacter fermentans]|uniref:integrase core domain-containing protein n=1 Tax=Anoxybacter fermentans TaxID=1323375 RepID=UPI000F8C65D4